MLRQEEITRCKFELGYNVTGVGAEPYITYTAVFDKAVEPYLIDNSTTSTTVVTAVSGGASVAITLAANPVITGLTAQSLTFVNGSNIIVDIGPNAERTQIQFISGLSVTVNLSLAHGSLGSYLIQLDGAEQTIRDIFTRLDIIKVQMRDIAPPSAGMSAVDEVKFNASAKGRHQTLDKFGSLMQQRDEARRDLADALGVPYLRDARKSTGGQFEVY